MLEIAFAGNPLDRADHRRDDDAWFAAALAALESRFAVFTDLKPLVDTARGLSPHWFAADDVRAALSGDMDIVLLGLDGATARFALAVDGATAAALLGGSVKAIDARSVAMAGHGPHLAIIAQGRAVLAWHARHKFCSVCGAPTRRTKSGYARRCTDAACDAEHFPRTDPVAIMLATRGDKCLLGRQAQFPGGFYSALAGFIEPGETIEEAVAREVAEEAGVRVGAVRYVASQPWPFPSSLMIGCLAEALGEEISVDKRELEDARWFSREAVAKALAGDTSAGLAAPPPLAIAHQLMRYWVSR